VAHGWLPGWGEGRALEKLPDFLCTQNYIGYLLSHPIYTTSHPNPIRNSGSVVNIDPIKRMVTSYLATPQGQEMILNYLSSPEGKQAICEFVTTPKGRAVMKQVLPCILSNMSLPPDLQSEVIRKLEEIS
jgi:hypothetical protein